MRKGLEKEILACPMDKGDLVLTIEEEAGDEVIRGYLTCQTCSEQYPIEDGIPNLLPPAMRQSK